VKDIVSVVCVDIIGQWSVMIVLVVRIFIRGVAMTRFVCLTCWKTKDDKEIKWWNDKQCCERCFGRYEKYEKN